MAVSLEERTVTIRLNGKDDARLRAAAEVCQESLTDFTLHSALGRADEILSGTEVTYVSGAQFEAMMAALAEPVTPIDEIVSLAAEPRIFTRK